MDCCPNNPINCPARTVNDRKRLAVLKNDCSGNIPPAEQRPSESRLASRRKIVAIAHDEALRAVESSGAVLLSKVEDVVAGPAARKNVAGLREPTAGFRTVDIRDQLAPGVRRLEQEAARSGMSKLRLSQSRNLHSMCLSEGAPGART